MKKYPLAGIGCLILAVMFFYLIENGDHPLHCMLLPAVFFIVGIYHIVPNKRELYEGPEESLESEFASFKEFIGEEALQGRTGGYFIEKSTTMSQALFPTIIPVGIIPKEKKEKYLFLAKEKPNRIIQNFSKSDCISSYESRDPNFVFSENNQEWGKWGGAIVIDLYFTIYAFSGFPELLDEAFVCWVAWHRKRMTIENLKAICERREDNKYLIEIFRYAVAQ